MECGAAPRCGLGLACGFAGRLLVVVEARVIVRDATGSSGGVPGELVVSQGQMSGDGDLMWRDGDAGLERSIAGWGWDWEGV